MTPTPLLPCAFCGSALVAECSETDDELGATWRFVRCTECCSHSGYYQSRYEALKAWNRRAPNAVEVAELRELINHLWNEDLMTPEQCKKCNEISESFEEDLLERLETETKQKE